MAKDIARAAAITIDDIEKVPSVSGLVALIVLSTANMIGIIRLAVAVFEIKFEISQPIVHTETMIIKMFSLL